MTELNTLLQSLPSSEVEAFESTLIKHHLTKSKFYAISLEMKDEYPLDVYVKMSVQYDSPRGITWEETQKIFKQYEDLLSDVHLIDMNTEQFIDTMWMSVDKYGLSADARWLYELDYKPEYERNLEERMYMHTIVARIIECNKQRMVECEKKMNYAKEQMKRIEHKETLEKQSKLKAELKSMKILRKELPPYELGCPDVYPTENRNDAIYMVADDLVQEMLHNKQHDWAQCDIMTLFKWSSNKYSINGDFCTAKQWYDSYHSAKEKKTLPSQLEKQEKTT